MPIRAVKGGLISGFILMAFMSVRSYLVFQSFEDGGASAPGYLLLLPLIAFVMGFAIGGLLMVYLSYRGVKVGRGRE